MPLRSLGVNESGVLEGKLLLAKQAGPVQTLVNLIASRPLTDKADQRETAYAYAVQSTVAVASYTRGKWQFGARWQYATGTPTTPIVGATYLSDINVFVPVYGVLNSDRMGPAHQLDIGGA